MQIEFGPKLIKQTNLLNLLITEPPRFLGLWKTWISCVALCWGRQSLRRWWDNLIIVGWRWLLWTLSCSCWHSHLLPWAMWCSSWMSVIKKHYFKDNYWDKGWWKGPILLSISSFQSPRKCILSGIRSITHISNASLSGCMVRAKERPELVIDQCIIRDLPCDSS